MESLRKRLTRDPASSLHFHALCGNPAVIRHASRRPEVLRPRLSVGLPIAGLSACAASHSGFRIVTSIPLKRVDFVFPSNQGPSRQCTNRAVVRGPSYRRDSHRFVLDTVCVPPAMLRMISKLRATDRFNHTNQKVMLNSALRRCCAGAVDCLPGQTKAASWSDKLDVNG